MLVLGIETSCDETGLALYEGDARSGRLLGSVLHSQIELHNKYGGVVPELASRDHIQRITPLLNELLDNCDKTLDDLQAVAYTSGPGLLGALLVGATFGRTLAFSLGLPALGIHHMEGHLVAPLLTGGTSDGTETDATNTPKTAPPDMPFTALLVSGGHTQLIEAARLGDYRLLGESVDDAAGEAFDKTAKLLGLGYPGGPALAACAEAGDPKRFTFPRPMTDRPGCDFSFSGLKTFARNTIAAHETEQQPLDDRTRADIARAFEEAVVATLIIKCRRALAETGHDSLVVAGGVGANRRLRAGLRQKLDAKVYFPSFDLCTDNGAMIAYAGWLRLQAGAREPLEVTTRARWPLSELAPP